VDAGLCATCRYRRDVTTPRGSSFILCDRSSTDRSYPKYPRLPVCECAGHAPVDPDMGEKPS
jgi:hypothetical protein